MSMEIVLCGLRSLKGCNLFLPLWFIISLLMMDVSVVLLIFISLFAPTLRVWCRCL